MKKLTFPENFIWGAAMAAEQVEGHGDTNKGLTVWDEMYQKKPEDFFQKVGPKFTSTFWQNYANDIDLMAKINLKSLRLSISWARLFPDGKNLSEQGLNFYLNVLKKLQAKKIIIFLTLFHFDLPLWVAKKGGFESLEVIESFKKYANFVFNKFGHLVNYFITFNEPIVPIWNGYQNDLHWPGIINGQRAAQATWGTIVAHAEVVNLFNQKYRHQLKAKIGVVINVAPPIPRDGINYTDDDLKACALFELLHNDVMLYPMVKGIIPQKLIDFAKKQQILPKYNAEQLILIKKIKVDFLGTNFYKPRKIKANFPIEKNHLVNFFKSYDDPNARYNIFRGWEIRPQSLYDLAMKIKNELNNIPFFISENGMGVQNEAKYRDQQKMINDNYRIAFISEHLEWLHKAIQDGANCFGYHHWTIIDNWSWKNGYKNRYGLIELDLKTQQRKYKKSAYWYQKVMNHNEIIVPYQKIEDCLDLKNTKYQKSK